jgi:hypothetical protein
LITFGKLNRDPFAKIRASVRIEEWRKEYVRHFLNVEEADVADEGGPLRKEANPVVENLYSHLIPNWKR